MIFNHATSKQTLYRDAINFAGANTGTFTIDDFTLKANFAYDRVVALIQKNDTRWKWIDSNKSERDVCISDIEANREDYTMEITHLKVLRIRVKDSQGNWVTLKPIDDRDADDDLLNTYGNPEYYNKDGMSILPLPIPNYSMTDGLEVKVQTGPEYFESTDTDKEPGFNPLFHRLISMYAALDWLIDNATAKNPLTHKINRVKERILEAEFELGEHYSSRDVDDVPILKPKRRNLNTGLSL